MRKLALVHREYDRTIEMETGPVKVQCLVTQVVVDSIVTAKRNRKERGRVSGFDASDAKDIRLFRRSHLRAPHRE